jgi:hypothetical protein
MKVTKKILAFLVVLFLFSCNSSKITSSWKAENTVTKPYHNIMVWGLLTEKDSALRNLMETHLVNDFISKGYHAVSSLGVYKEKAYKKLTSKEIVNEFKLTGIDAVVTIVLLSKEKEEKYYPATITTQQGNLYGDLDKYYSNIFEKVLVPGYMISTTNYFWESNLFEVANDRMIYSVRTKSFDPLNSAILAHENGERIIKDMVKQKIIIAPAAKED